MTTPTYTVKWLYSTNSLWKSIRVIRLVVGHGVLCDLASLRAVSRERGEGGGLIEASLRWCRVELILRLATPSRDQVPPGNATVTRGTDDVVGVVCWQGLSRLETTINRIDKGRGQSSGPGQGRGCGRGGSVLLLVQPRGYSSLGRKVWILRAGRIPGRRTLFYVSD